MAYGFQRCFSNRIDHLRLLGNHVKKLIGSNKVLNELRSVFPFESELISSVDYYIGLLRELGNIQRCAKSDFLTPEEQILLKNAINKFKESLFEVGCSTGKYLKALYYRFNLKKGLVLPRNSIG